MRKVTLKSAILQKCVGVVIRRERLAKGFSQEGFADHVGLHRTYIGSLERGERNVTLKNLLIVAQALELSTSALIGQAERLATKSASK